MLILYNVTATIINKISNLTVTFNKNFESDLSVNESLLYNNYHVLHDDIYILDLFTQEVSDYCISEGITTNDIEIDEYEIISLTEKIDVFFENSQNANVFTLTPAIKCYVYPKEEPLPVPNLIGTAYDSSTIIWTWPDDQEYAHYLVEEPIDIMNESDVTKIIAQLPIGQNSYIETNLTPNTAYTRRLINYTDTQTSIPSSEVTVRTETVTHSLNVEQYEIEENYDFTTTDAEREVVQENLKAFHSGVGDFNDLKIYKQMDSDFYEKFKAYFEVTGRYTQREKRYDQVGFNYKICLEAMETIEEQEGEVTFKITDYPKQKVTVSQDLFATHPLTVFAKVGAYIDLYKEGTQTVEETIDVEYTTEEWVDPVSIPMTFIISIDLSSSMRKGSPKRIETVKSAALTLGKEIFNNPKLTNPQVIIAGYAHKVHTVKCTTLTQYNSVINNMKCGQNASDDGYIDGVNIGNTTNWEAGLSCVNKGETFDTSMIRSGDKVSMIFFTDGYPNDCNEYGIRAGISSDKWRNEMIAGGGTHTNRILTSIKNGALASPAKAIWAIFTGASREYNDDGIYFTKEYVDKAKAMITNRKKCKGKTTINTSNADNFDATEIVTAFVDALNAFIAGYWEPVTTSASETINTPLNTMDVKTIYVESDPIPFTFDATKTPVVYSQAEKRFVIAAPLPTTQMSGVSLYDMLWPKVTSSPEYLAGYNENNTVNDESGNPVGYIFKNLTIQDTYHYGAEDEATENPPVLSSSYEYALMGSVNVFTDIGNIVTPTPTDDYYVVSKSNYLWISGFTEGIIYEGSRFATSEINAYNKPQVTLLYENQARSVLRNRLNNNVSYPGNMYEIVAFTDVIEKGKFIQLTGDGYTGDMVAKISEVWTSPILNYKFNLEDPDAYTPYFEILPQSDRNSKDYHIVILDIYYAKNVYINNIYTANFDYNNNNGIPITYSYMNEMLDEYIHFFAEKMIKTQPYYDELPGPGLDTLYGLINGRYNEENTTGKQDLKVDTPQFNIPTTVTDLHASSIKIYIKVTEFYPDTALVAYKWAHETSDGFGITQVNGDYVTFSCDSLTYKDIEYKDLIGTYEMDDLELYDFKTKEEFFTITRPIDPNEAMFDPVTYNYNNTTEWQTNSLLSGLDGIQINTQGMLYGPFVELTKGKYRVHISGFNLNGCEFEVASGATKFAYKVEERTNTSITYVFELFQTTYDVEFKVINNGTEPVFVDYYTTLQYNTRYDKYLLKVTTNNGDVLPSRYPSEITFDENNQAVIPVTFRGIVNATSKWSPRIHNGFYYINQHEHYLYSEFNVEANFDTQTEVEYDKTTAFVSIEVTMQKPGGSPEDYSILKDTLAELLQDEDYFAWNNGVTIKPAVEGLLYKHYLTRTYYSPIILFKNPLTTAYNLHVHYKNTDGSETGLNLYVRSYDLELGKWTDWVPFENGTVPQVVLSAGYQIKTDLSATEVHTPYDEDDYMACYLDWQEDILDTMCVNITTITDHLTTGELESEGIFVSKIIKFGCESGLALSMYTSHPSVKGYIAFSNNVEDLIVENIKWSDMSVSNLNMQYKYYRYKIVIPYGEKVYWLHKSFRTLKTEAVLPYITSISMNGRYEPVDVTGSFLNIEAFEILKDGLYHRVIESLQQYIEADVINKGFALDDIKKINIQSTDPNVTLLFNDEVLLENPDPTLLQQPIDAATNELLLDKTIVLPYIFTENTNQIVINGTPQQFSPIGIEDDQGRTYTQLFSKQISANNMIFSEAFDIKKKTKYIELKYNNYDKPTLKVWLNDDIMLETDYDIINHLVIFKDYIEEGNTITISYNIRYSFYADVNREYNKTTIYLYTETGVAIPEKARVMFETSLKNNKKELRHLSLNPTYRTEYNGFLYLTDQHFEPFKINMYCNPKRIKSGGYDKVDVIIEVLDILGNPVIGADISVDCLTGIINADSYTTDINGVVHLIYGSSFAVSTDTITAKYQLPDLKILTNSIEIINY